jgi:hypothetical protein
MVCDARQDSVLHEGRPTTQPRSLEHPLAWPDLHGEDDAPNRWALRADTTEHARATTVEEGLTSEPHQSTEDWKGSRGD